MCRQMRIWGLVVGILLFVGGAIAEKESNPAANTGEILETAEHKLPDFAQKALDTLIKEKKDQPQCHIVSRGLDKRYLEFNGELAKTISSVLESIQKTRGKDLAGLIHPRLRVQGKKATTMINELYGAFGTLDAQVYRLYGLYTVDTSPEVIDCSEDQLSIGTHYGYPLQWGLWLNFSGKEELGRLYLTIVPTESGYRIGAWHRQQWTHLGKDAEAWVQEGLKAVEEKRPLAAYIKLDIAQKLLDGGKFIFMQLRRDAVATRDAQLPQGKSWLQSLRPHLGEVDVVYAGSHLARDGVGIYFRIAIKEELKVPQLEELCKKAGSGVYAQEWAQAIASLHCDFTHHGSPPDRPGAFGGVTLGPAELRSQ